ncbi:MAG: hypothetical protein ABH883_01815 [Candidatus Omnitrophota bacterium]
MSCGKNKNFNKNNIINVILLAGLLICGEKCVFSSDVPSGALHVQSIFKPLTDVSGAENETQLVLETAMILFSIDKYIKQGCEVIPYRDINCAMDIWYHNLPDTEHNRTVFKSKSRLISVTGGSLVTEKDNSVNISVADENGRERRFRIFSRLKEIKNAPVCPGDLSIERISDLEDAACFKEGCMYDYKGRYDAEVEKFLMAQAREEAARKAVGADSETEAYHLLKDSTRFVITRNGRKVIYSGLLKYHRKKVMEIAAVLNAEVPFYAGVKVSPCAGYLFISRYYIPHPGAMIPIKEKPGSEKACGEEKREEFLDILFYLDNDRTRFVRNVIRKIKRAASDEKDPCHKRAVELLEIGERRVIDKLDELYGASYNGEDLKNRVFMSLGISGEWDGVLRIHKIRRELRNPEFLSQLFPEYIKSACGEDIDARGLNGAQIEAVVNKIMREVFLFVVSPRSCLRGHRADFEAEEAAKERSEQLISCHVHPFQTAFEKLNTLMMERFLVYDRNKIKEFFSERLPAEQLEQIVDDHLASLEEDMGKNDERIRELEELINEIKKNGFKQARDSYLRIFSFFDSVGFSRILRPCLSNIDESIRGENEKAAFIIYLLSERANTLRRIKRELGDVYRAITDTRDFISRGNVPSGDIIEHLTFSGFFHDSGTFARSEKDAEHESEYRIISESGQALDEILSIIENPLGTSFIISYREDSGTVINQDTEWGLRLSCFNRYQIGRGIEGRYRIVGNRDLSSGESLDTFNYVFWEQKFDSVMPFRNFNRSTFFPSVVVKEKGSGRYFQMLPRDPASWKDKRYAGQMIFLMENGFPGLVFKNDTVDGKEVLLIEIFPRVDILSNEKKKYIRQAAFRARKGMLEIVDIMKAAESFYRTGRILYRAAKNGLKIDKAFREELELEESIQKLLDIEGLIREGIDLELEDVIKKKLLAGDTVLYRYNTIFKEMARQIAPPGKRLAFVGKVLTADDKNDLTPEKLHALRQEVESTGNGDSEFSRVEQEEIFEAPFSGEIAAVKLNNPHKSVFSIVQKLGYITRFLSDAEKNVKHNGSAAVMPGVDIVIDNTFISGRDFEDSAKTVAYLIMLCEKKRHPGVNYVFKQLFKKDADTMGQELLLDISNAAEASKIASRVKEIIRDDGHLFLDRAGVDGLIGRIRSSLSGADFEIPVLNGEWLRWRKRAGIGLKEKEYPVAIDGFTSEPGGALFSRSVEAALATALCKSVLLRCQRRMITGTAFEKDFSDVKERTVEELNEIYSLVYGTAFSITENTVEYMIYPGADKRLDLAIGLALPPAARFNPRETRDLHEITRDASMSA